MSKVVEEARRWIGTPYLHQGAQRKAGCDCLGLIRGVWRALYGDEPQDVPPYSADWDEPQGREVLWAAAQRYLTPLPQHYREPGTILLFRMRSSAVAKHLGILSKSGDMPAFIHAYNAHGVVESPLSTPWQRRIVARFAFEKG